MALADERLPNLVDDSRIADGFEAPPGFQETPFANLLILFTILNVKNLLNSRHA